MKITLKDGVREFENGMNALDIAGQLSQELKKQALAARMDGERKWYSVQWSPSHRGGRFFIRRIGV